MVTKPLPVSPSVRLTARFMTNAANNESTCDANNATVESKKRKTANLQGQQYRGDDKRIANQKKTAASLPPPFS